MNNSLERIQIIGLHGNINMDVEVEDNTLLLVGENGSGKTTFLRILFYVLSGNWLNLTQFQFKHIIVTINKMDYTVKYDDIPQKISDRQTQEKHEYFNKFMYYLDRDESKEISEDKYIKQNPELKEKINAIQQAFSTQILYLPTYRRIERELESIFRGTDIDMDDYRLRKNHSRLRKTHSNTYIELVEFGMKDVRDAISKTLDSLKEFSRENLNNLTREYLRDILNKQYENVGIEEITSISKDTIDAVLDRSDERILTITEKQHLFYVINSDDNSEYRKIIAHYFFKLFQFQQTIEKKEELISKFCSLCSEYITDKQFLYDATKFSFSIAQKNINDSSNQIDLSELSSGEKQIVSLFSHLYLSENKNFFVLIDEPELSLSVPWQNRFLTDIRNSGLCSGLIAATHSPFIYENELQTHVHSLSEFFFTNL